MSLMAEKYPHLLDPEALEGPRLQRVAALFNGYDAEEVARRLNRFASTVAVTPVEEIPASVIIQARQEPAPASRHKATAPDHQAELIIATAKSLRAQMYGSLVIAASVDYPDFRTTAAERSELDNLGVQVMTEYRSTNNAQALNRAFKGLGQTEGMTVVMPSGNRFVTDQALRAAAMHIGEGDAVAAYGPRLMDNNTTDRIGRELLSGDSEYYEQYAEVIHNPSPDDNGYMSPAGVALCSTAWTSAPLDEGFGRGGAVRHWGAMLQSEEFDVVYEPAMAVHDHSNPGEDTLREEALWLRYNVWPVN